MPVYVYKCSSCSAIYEINRPVDSRDVPTDCGQCKSPLKRLFTAPAVAFKGSGFYHTDNRKMKNQSTAAKAGGSSGEKESAP
jgi:putative FmdB family regulatory protein